MRTAAFADCKQERIALLQKELNFNINSPIKIVLTKVDIIKSKVIM